MHMVTAQLFYRIGNHITKSTIFSVLLGFFLRFFSSGARRAFAPGLERRTCQRRRIRGTRAYPSVSPIDRPTCAGKVGSAARVYEGEKGDKIPRSQPTTRVSA